jgi:hypothetical protein
VERVWVSVGVFVFGSSLFPSEGLDGSSDGSSDGCFASPVFVSTDFPRKLRERTVSSPHATSSKLKAEHGKFGGHLVTASNARSFSKRCATAAARKSSSRSCDCERKRQSFEVRYEVWVHCMGGWVE